MDILEMDQADPPGLPVGHARHVGRQLFTEITLVAVAVAIAVLAPVLGRDHVTTVLVGGLGLMCAAVPVGAWVGEAAMGPRPHAALVGAFGAVTCLAVGLLAGGTWSVLRNPAHLGMEASVYERIVQPLFWGTSLGGWIAAPMGALAGWLTVRRLRA